MKDFKDRFIRMFIMGFRQLQDPYYQGFAAQVSFYFVLSIVPIIILIVQILGLFNISMGTALSLLYGYTGHQISTLMGGLFEFSSLGFGNIIYIIIALWAGSRASFALTRIANYTLTEGDSTGKNYFVERVRAIGTLFFTISTIVFSILILCYGKLILSGVITLIGREPAQYVDSIWFWLRWPLGFILYFGMIGFNFYLLPTVKRPFRKVIPGTIFAAVGMLVVTWLYSVYAGSLANYDIVYGALSSVVAMLMWFFFLAWVLLLGVFCNKVWDDTSQPFSKRRPPEHLIMEQEWRQSKFDTDPDEFGIGIIKDILMGDDHPEPAKEVDWTPEEDGAKAGSPEDGPKADPQ
ncbi:MAG: YihY/virulence factor BrkB family protein [Firmicutes bacterium]|nr:YihY/virulence factor BrkB family protein [Bacillota bacterium]